MKGYEVKSDGLNIRTEPSAKSDSVDIAAKGDLLLAPIGWVPVVMEDGTIGWISERFTKPADVEFEEEPAKVGTITTSNLVKAIVTLAEDQEGDRYVFGAEASKNDPDPDVFDCSELVEWVCARCGVKPVMPDGAANQYEHCWKYGTLITVDKGIKTYGALLFRIASSGNHVAISRGNGTTIEAKGKDYGVGIFDATGRPWTHAALIPGVTYGV